MRRAVLFAAACVLVALHPTYISSALLEGNVEISTGLEWIRTWALDVAESDTDKECYTVSKRKFEASKRFRILVLSPFSYKLFKYLCLYSVHIKRFRFLYIGLELFNGDKVTNIVTSKAKRMSWYISWSHCALLFSYLF